MKNKQFKDYLREQERHHIKRSKKRDEPNEDELINAHALTSAMADWSQSIFIDVTRLEWFAVNWNGQVWTIVNPTSFVATQPTEPPSWTASIRYTLEGGKKILTWHMPSYAAAFVEEICYSHAHNRTLFRRYAAQSPLTLDDQCQAVGLTLVGIDTGQALGFDVFPVTALSELEAAR